MCLCTLITKNLWVFLMSLQSLIRLHLQKEKKKLTKNKEAGSKSVYMSLPSLNTYILV